MDTITGPLQALLDTVPAPPGARIVEQTVDYTDDEGTPCTGILVADASRDAASPAVVVVHDWYGISDTTRVRLHMFARLGYAAFAVDMYGSGIRPASVEDAQREAGAFASGALSYAARVGAGVAAAASMPSVDRSRMVVLGYCFGGTAALEFARTGPDLRGVAAFHAGLPSHPGEPADMTGPVLIMTGGDDPVVPDAAVVAYQDELRAQPGLDWQVVTYAGAPHAFTVPGESYRPVADRRSWREITGFLAEVFDGSAVDATGRDVSR